jgi:hypothetical protein
MKKPKKTSFRLPSRSSTSVKDLGHMLVKPSEVFENFWATKRTEGVPEMMREDYEEAFKAGSDSMRDLAEAYSAYVMIYHDENGPCQDTGNTPVSFDEWATCDESERVLEGEEYECPMGRKG